MASSALPEAKETPIYSLIPKTGQVLENQLEMAIANGLKFTKGLTKKRIFDAIAGGATKFEKLKTQRADAYQEYVEHVRFLSHIRHLFAQKLEQILLSSNQGNLSEYGVDIPQFKETQHNAIAAFSWALRHGYQRLPFQIPTGGGKSHVLGAIIRAYRETLTELGLDEEQEIVVVTSRGNLVSQLVQNGDQQSYEDADEEEEDYEGVNIGDIRQWLNDVVSDDRVRALATSISGVQREKAKDSLVTIETYQGLDEARVDELHSSRKVGLVLLDEAHNATERVRAVINTKLSGSLIIGGSATIKGPDRNPFLLFEEIRKDPTSLQEPSFHEKLAFHESMSAMMERRELKRMRWLQAKVNIDLSRVRITSAGNLNEDDLSKLLGGNLPLMKQFIRDTLKGNHPVLQLAHSKPLQDRTHIAFVKRIAIAKVLAEFCSDELDYPADFTSGEDSGDEFERKKAALRAGDLRMLFSSRKLTEGFDAPEVNAVWNLWPHPLRSEWMLSQEIGRGVRINPNDPDDDCVVIDATYNAGRHNLATVLGLFGDYQAFNGGLLGDGAMRKLETKMLLLLQQGIPLKDLPSHLSADDRKLALLLGWKFETPDGKTRKGGHVDKTDIQLQKLEYIENARVRKMLAGEDRAVFLEFVRDVLTMQGYPDRSSILKASLRKFKSTDFPEIGSGIKLYNALTGKVSQCIIKEELREIANILYPVEYDEESDPAAMLRRNGYGDRWTLLHADTTKFASAEFGYFGKGLSFYSSVCGKSNKFLTRECLIEIADIFYPTTSPTEEREYWKGILVQRGYATRDSLVVDSMAAFKAADFSPFGKSLAFYQAAMRSDIRVLRKEDMILMADRFYPPESGENTYLTQVLRKAGYEGRSTLLEENPKTFASKDFGDFGSGLILCSTYLNEHLQKLNKGHLKLLADKILPVEINSEKDQQKQLLEANGYRTRESLLRGNITVFIKQRFGKYGLGKAFYGAVMGKTSGQVMLMQNLRELADIFYPAACPEDETDPLRLLAKNGYPDRTSLLNAEVKKFRDKHFGIYGTAQAFVRSMVGQKHENHLLREDLWRLADKLYPVEKQEEGTDDRDPLKILQGLGYNDRESMLTGGLTSFKSHQFGLYGGPCGFYRKVFGVKTVLFKNEQLRKLADHFYPTTSPETETDPHTLLRNNGYPDRNSLLNAGAHIFTKQPFGTYGKGGAFYKHVMGVSPGALRKEHMIALADKMYPVSKRELEDGRDFKKILKNNGYPDRDSLLNANVNTFGKQQFGIYGKGRAFYTAVTGTPLTKEQLLLKQRIIEIADIIFP